MEEEEKTFILYWIGKQTELVKGRDIADAFNKAGYKNDDINLLYYFKEIKNE